MSAGCKPVDELAQDSRVVLVYGEAGAGKTTLALYLLSLRCGSCIYVSTERLDFLKRLEGMGTLDLSRLTVYEAFDYTDFLDVLFYSRLAMADAVAVDSINAYARGGEEPQLYTMLLAAALRQLSERLGILVVETAQVHFNPETGELEPVLGSALELWADTLIEVERRPGGRRLLKLKKPGASGWDYVVEAEITGRGLQWLSC